VFRPRLARGLRAVLALCAACAFGASASCSERADSDSPAPEPLAGKAQSVVFGADDRAEVSELVERGALDLVELSRAVALLTDSAALDAQGRPQITCAGDAQKPCTRDCQRCDLRASVPFSALPRACAPPLEVCPELCADEPFREQASAGHCTGFLLAPDLLATAGHCLAEQPCARTAVVFGYRLQASGAGSAVVKEALDTYHCAEVIAAQHGASTTPDWALLRLDRPVRDRVPLCLAAPPGPRVGDPLVLAGHPLGLPLKVDDGGELVRLSPTGSSLLATTDSFAGHSGSAVLDARTLQVVGILARGPRYAFAVQPGTACSRSRVCDAKAGCGGAFPEATLIEPLRRFVPAGACFAPGQRCTSDSACAPACACRDGSCAQGLECGRDVCATLPCTPAVCRAASCDAATGCARVARADCTPCGGGALCVAGRCGAPAHDGFEQGLADDWAPADRRPEWFVTDARAATGVASLRAEPTGPFAQRRLERRATTRAGASVVFRYLLDAAEDDALVFEVDGAAVASLRGPATGWAEYSFPPAASDGYLAAGAHRFGWRFVRGGQAPLRENTVYLDDVTIVGLALSCPCLGDADCLDGIACNGEERCSEGVCLTGATRCAADRVCDAQHDRCVECVSDADCHAGARCLGRICQRGTPDADSGQDASAALTASVPEESAETSSRDAASQGTGDPGEAVPDARGEPAATPSSCRAAPRSAVPSRLPAWFVVVLALGLWRGTAGYRCWFLGRGTP